jgi:hypothetical protein
MSLEELGKWLDLLPWQKISLGYRELQTFKSTELEKGQLGYRSDERGNSLIGKDGAWENSWYVIGWDELGDPYFIDIESERVFTAIHGHGLWEPECIAMDVESFVLVLKRLHELSLGRNTPTALEENPLSKAEIQSFIDFSVKRNKATDGWNWELWVKQE